MSHLARFSRHNSLLCNALGRGYLEISQGAVLGGYLWDEDGRSHPELPMPQACEKHVPMEFRRCSYPDSRYRNRYPMNVSALKQITENWDGVLALIRALTNAGGACEGIDDSSAFFGRVAALNCMDWFWHLEHPNGGAPPVPAHLSAAIKAGAGFNSVARLLLERAANSEGLGERPTLSGERIFAAADQTQLLISESEVCAGPKHLIIASAQALLGKQQGESAVAMLSAAVATVPLDVERWMQLASIYTDHHFVMCAMEALADIIALRRTPFDTEHDVVEESKLLGKFSYYREACSRDLEVASLLDMGQAVLEQSQGDGDQGRAIERLDEAQVRCFHHLERMLRSLFDLPKFYKEHAGLEERFVAITGPTEAAHEPQNEAKMEGSGGIKELWLRLLVPMLRAPRTHLLQVGPTQFDGAALVASLVESGHRPTLHAELQVLPSERELSAVEPSVEFNVAYLGGEVAATRYCECALLLWGHLSSAGVLVIELPPANSDAHNALTRFLDALNRAGDCEILSSSPLLVLGRRSLP